MKKDLAHQFRVLEECDNLSEKIKKINDFIETGLFSALATNEKMLFLNQRYAMREYHAILLKRIAAFK